MSNNDSELIIVIRINEVLLKLKEFKINLLTHEMAKLFRAK